MVERYSLIVVTDETSPIRRFDLHRRTIKRAITAAVVLAIALAVGLVDYVRVRIDQVELDSLRTETIAQRDRIAGFEQTLEEVEGNLQRLEEFERKVRTIANLPGSTATGGEEVSEVDPEQAGDLAGGQGGVDGLAPPVDGLNDGMRQRTPPDQLPTDPGERVGALRIDAERLGLVANAKAMSLEELVNALEKKRHKLASSPAIWPTKGWLTSRFGNRISPFTGRRQFHAGIDIAGARGTPVLAPARGEVVFAGTRGPLGKSLIIDHGYGVRTLYGHNDELLVKRGEEVERGQKVAKLGSSGRSTGPHLHYVVEVNGKARNPLDYIFD